MRRSVPHVTLRRRAAATTAAAAHGFIMGDGRICDPIRHMGC